MAVGFGENPFLLTVPAALGASCAFMLPVATPPPNAIVYGSDELSIPEMTRVGGLNLTFIVLITGLAYGLLGAAFGVELGVVPDWAVGEFEEPPGGAAASVSRGNACCLRLKLAQRG